MHAFLTFVPLRLRLNPSRVAALYAGILLLSGIMHKEELAAAPTEHATVRTKDGAAPRCTDVGVIFAEA